MTERHPTPTLDQLVEATGGKLSRDGESVVVGYGSIGYLRVLPDWVIVDGQEIPAARIDGRLRAANGAKHSDLRDRLRAADIYPH